MTAWVAILAAAAVVGISLGLLGGGGSVLTLPVLVYGLGLEAVDAIATSLFVVGVTSLVAAVSHARAGAVRWKIAITFAVPSMIGAYFGGRLAEFVPRAVLLFGFAAMMFAGAFTMLRARGSAGAGATADGPKTVRSGLVAAEGAVVGVITGLVGAGGGFLVVPALLALGTVTVAEAIGTSLVVIALKSAGGLAGQLAHAHVPWELATVFAGTAIVGSLAGSRLSRALPPRTLRRIFAVMIVVVAVGIIAAEWVRLAGVRV